jgi:hypothetical protein
MPENKCVEPGLFTAEPVTAAIADVIPPEQRPLRAGKIFQHGAHR